MISEDKHRRVCFINASEQGQFSQESEDWGCEDMVYLPIFLLKGLNGDVDYSREVVISIGELTAYVSHAKCEGPPETLRAPLLRGDMMRLWP